MVDVSTGCPLVVCFPAARRLQAVQAVLSAGKHSDCWVAWGKTRSVPLLSNNITPKSLEILMWATSEIQFEINLNQGIYLQTCALAKEIIQINHQ